MAQRFIRSWYFCLLKFLGHIHITVPTGLGLFKGAQLNLKLVPSPSGSAVKNLSAVQETQEMQVLSLDQEGPLEQGTAFFAYKMALIFHHSFYLRTQQLN